MKEVKKKVHSRLVDSRTSTGCGGMRTYKYTFEILEPVNGEDIELYLVEQEPENMNEFLGFHGVSKKDLVKWLNENYK